MILVDEKITAHLHKILKRCPVCRTKYKKSDIPFHRIRLSKSDRLKVRKEVLRVCGYEKNRSLIIKLLIVAYEKLVKKIKSKKRKKK